MRIIRYGLCVVVWLACLGQASAATFWGLTGDQHLVRFTSTAPGTILVDLPISGVPAGEHIIAIQQLLVVTKTFVVPPTSRFNLPVDSSTVPEITDATFGVDIMSSVPIMVERSMYSNAIGQIWAAGTNATATRLP